MFQQKVKKYSLFLITDKTLKFNLSLGRIGFPSICIVGFMAWFPQPFSWAYTTVNTLRHVHVTLAQLLASSVLCFTSYWAIFSAYHPPHPFVEILYKVQNDLASRINTIFYWLVHTHDSWDWFLFKVFTCQGVIVHQENVGLYFF